MSQVTGADGTIQQFQYDSCPLPEMLAALAA